MNKNIIYNIKWKQTYSDWDMFVEGLLEQDLESKVLASQLKEAKEVIERIKNGYAS